MENKEQIKIALLAIIAGTLIIQTVIFSGDKSDTYTDSAAASSPPSAGNTLITQQPSNSTDITPSLVQQPQSPVVSNAPATAIKFVEESWNFGNIKQNSTSNKSFKFTNTGKNPLIIENAQGSCGCTVPKFPKEPILPGGTADIEVEYKPGSQKGNQQKTVTITANTEPRETKLSISAFVEEDGTVK